MRYTLLIGIILLSNLISAQNQSDKHVIFGSPYASQITKVCSDKDGNVYVSGEFSKSLLMGSNRFKDTWGGFIAKLNSENKLLWLNRADFQVKGLKCENNTLYLIAQFSKHGVLCEEELENGSNTFNSVVAAINTETGCPVWKNYLKSEQDVFSTDITFDNNGNIYFIGAYTGLLKVGDYQLESTHSKSNYIGKIDNSGQIKWIKRISGGEDIITGVTSSAIAYIPTSDKILVAGSFSGKAWFGNTVISSKKIESEHGYTYYQNEVFAARFNTNGDFVDIKTLITEANLNDVLVVDSIFYLCGYFRGTIFKDFEPGISFFGKNLQLKSGVGAAGNLLETMYVAAFYNDSALWAFAPSGINNSRMLSLSIDNENNIYAGGFFYDQIDLPDGTRINASGKELSSNIFVSKFNKKGEILEYHSADVKNTIKLFDLSFGNELVIGGQVTGKASISNTGVESRGKHQNGYIYRFLVD